MQPPAPQGSQRKHQQPTQPVQKATRTWISPVGISKVVSSLLDFHRMPSLPIFRVPAVYNQEGGGHVICDARQPFTMVSSVQVANKRLPKVERRRDSKEAKPQYRGINPRNLSQINCDKSTNYLKLARWWSRTGPFAQEQEKARPKNQAFGRPSSPCPRTRPT